MGSLNIVQSYLLFLLGKVNESFLRQEKLFLVKELTRFRRCQIVLPLIFKDVFSWIYEKNNHYVSHGNSKGRRQTWELDLSQLQLMSGAFQGNTHHLVVGPDICFHSGT